MNKPLHRPFEGKVALVTGGGVRIGRALALGMAELGCDVAVHYNGSKAGAEEVVQLVQADGNRAVALQADLTQKGFAEPLVDAVEKALGPIHILINSAGVFYREPLVSTSEELLELQWALNARAPYTLTQAAVKRMLPTGGGHVLNIVDIGGGICAWANYSAYCMSKAALGMMTKSLALELAPTIRVNGIAPGSVMPPEDMPKATLELLKARIPQKRFGAADDVVQTAKFLLTGPDFITGQLIAVDGGRSVGLPSSVDGADVA